MATQQDYKEIAIINKMYLSLLIPKKDYERFVNKQADYFEREDDTDNCDCARCKMSRFNRQQFLCLCGVGK